MLRAFLFASLLITVAVAADDVCSLPRMPGACFGYFERWFFNKNSSTCEKFIFGGCQGNDNNFESEKECKEVCDVTDDVCKLPKIVGPCEADAKRWFFNEHGVCEKFSYGGCQGNANNFASEKDCRERCEESNCPLVRCRSHCLFGFETDENGCQTCICKVNTNCPNIECDALFCVNGYETDIEGCPTCKCKQVECSPIRCRMACENGFDTDENGCEICKCKPKSTPTDCPEAMCMMYCEHGFKVDENDCPICKCNEGPTCAPVVCDMACENGFDTDEKGCAVCRCKRKPKPTPRVCPDVMCAMYCEHGFEENEEGCPVCKCKQEPPCPVATCRLFCENGFEMDETGCAICKCKQPKTTPPAPSPSACPGVTCQMACVEGFERDDRGCEVCRCRGPPPTPEPSRHTCAAVMCAMFCEYGFEVDENGCEICQCRTQPACPVIRCRPCRHGYRKDNRGCQTCQCKDHACEDIECSEGKTCRVQELQCFAAPCPLLPHCVEISDEHICQLPMETGRCRAYFQHWYFNSKNARCERFIYGGCGGNANNFETEALCKAKCGELVTCDLFCEFGHADKNGCVCNDNPCLGMLCGKGKVCVAKKMGTRKHEAMCVYDEDSSVEHTFVIENALPTNDLDIFKSELHHHLRQWLQVDGDRLLTLEMTEPVDDQPLLRVTFRLANDPHDSSSKVLARFAKKIHQGVCVLHFGGEAYPVKTGSQSWHEGQKQPKSESSFSRNDVIITASMVALVCVLAIIAIVVICMYTRTKRNRALTDQELAFNNAVYGGSPVITAPSAQEQPEKIVPGTSLLETKPAA